MWKRNTREHARDADDRSAPLRVLASLRIHE